MKTVLFPKSSINAICVRYLKTMSVVMLLPLMRIYRETTTTGKSAITIPINRGKSTMLSR